MEETKWNKKFNKIVAPEMGNDIENMDQRNNDDISHMEQKIRRINDKNKGFSNLPALDSIYTPDDSMEPSNFNAVDPVVEGTLIEGLKGKKAKKAKKSKKAKKATPTSSKKKTAPKTTFIQSLKDIMNIEQKVRDLLGISKRVSADASKKVGDATQSIKGLGREGFDNEDEDEGFEDQEGEEGFGDSDEEEGLDNEEEETEGFDNEEEEGKEGFKKRSTSKKTGLKLLADTNKKINTTKNTGLRLLADTNKKISTAKKTARKTGLELLAEMENAFEITFKHILNLLYIPIGIWITFNLYNLLAPMPVPTSTTSVDTESPLKFLQLIFPIFFIFSKIGDIGGWCQKKLEPLVGDMPNTKSYRPSVFIVILASVYIGLYYFQALPGFFALVSRTLDDIDKMINKKAFEEATAKVKAGGENVLGKAKAGLKKLGFISDKDITVIITILTVIGVVATTAISNPIIGLVATFLYIGMALTLKPVLMLGFSLILIVELTLNVFLFPYPALTNVVAIYKHIIEGTSEDWWPRWSKTIVESIFSWYVLLAITGMSSYAIVDIFRHMNATYRNAAIGIFSVPIVVTVGVIAFKIAIFFDKTRDQNRVQPSDVKTNNQVQTV